METEKKMAVDENVLAVYCRVSKGDGSQSKSIDNQILLAKNWIGRDEASAHCALRIFEDDGYTGTNMNRPAVQKMLAGIFLGKIQALVVKDFSRLSRNHLVLAELLETVFPRYPVRVVSIGDNYDSDYDHPDLENGIKNLFYEYYCRDISNKTKRALRAKRQKGGARPGKCPYGYEKDPGGKLVVKQREAETVCRIYRLCIGGRNCPRIAELLNQETDDRRWSASAVWQILHDPVYMGVDPWHKSESQYRNGFVRVGIPRDMWRINENSHQAIISRKMYEEAGKWYPEKENGGAKRRGRHLYHGLTKCGICGKALCRHSSDSNLLICKKDAKKIRIPIAGLSKMICGIFGIESEKYLEIFLRIFIRRIIVSNGNIRIQLKVIVENEFIL